MSALADQTPESARPPQNHEDGLRVLLVEDNPGERWLFAEILRSRGHTVTACEDAEVAWKTYQEEPFPLIVLDWLLPGTDGLELCRRIRGHPEGDHCVVVVVTGRNHPEALEEVLDSGADDYIAKPVDVALLNVRLAVAEREVRALHRRTLTEQALEARTRELGTLFDNLDEVFFSIDVKEERLIQVSPASERILGRTPDQLRSGREEWERYLLPETLERAVAFLSAGDESRASYVVQFPVAGAKNGPTWVEGTYKPDRNEAGELIRIDGVLTDITARREAQEEITARHQELLTLYRISEVTLAAQSLEEGYREILGEVSHVTGYPIVAIEHYDEAHDEMVVAAALGFPPDLMAGELPRIPASDTLSGVVVRTGKPVAEPDVRTRPEHKSDILLDLGVRAYLAFPMFLAGRVVGTLTLAHTEIVQPENRLVRWTGSLANYIASFLDRVQAENALKQSEQEYRLLAEQLQQANQELESFAYSVSHDLRAPLRTMQGFAHALLQDYGDSLEPDAKDYGHRIIQSGQRAEDLIRDLLAYSRLSFEEVELKTVDLAGVIQTALEQIQGDLRESNAEIVIGEPMPRALGHHTTLVQIIVNLISNAIKFVEDGTGPKVRVHAEEEGDWVRLWVEDNGPGIPEDQQEKVFRTFERGSDSTEVRGTGIGLAIVRRGMERMGGRAGLESAPGQGSRFWVDLPKPKSRLPHRRR